MTGRSLLAEVLPVTADRQPGLRRWYVGFHWILLGLAALSTLGSDLGIWSSHVERMSHFRLWWLGLLSILAVFLFVCRRRWLALLPVALFLLAIAPILPYWRHHPTGNPSEAKAVIKVVSWNVLHENPDDRERATRWLAGEGADLILLTECTLSWRDTVSSLFHAYPYRISSGRDGAEGMLLMSRFPLGSPDPEGIAENKPWISTNVQFPSGPVRFIGMHPRTPRSGKRFDERNIQYDQASKIASKSELPLILAGDLNCTPFSPWFRRLTERGRLVDTALGHGFKATWTSNGIGLPIDHILVSSGWQVIERKVYPDRMGSDHHPVTAILAR